MKQSKLFTVNLRDLLHALLMSIIGVIILWAQEVFIPSLQIPIEVKTMILLSLSYLSKKFFQKSHEEKIQSLDGDGAGVPSKGL